MGWHRSSGFLVLSFALSQQLYDHSVNQLGELSPRRVILGGRREAELYFSQISFTKPELPPNKNALSCSESVTISLPSFHGEKASSWQGQGNLNLKESRYSFVYICLDKPLSAVPFPWIIFIEFPAVPWIYSGGSGSRPELQRLSSLCFSEAHHPVNWGALCITCWLSQEGGESIWVFAQKGLKWLLSASWQVRRDGSKG